MRAAGLPARLDIAARWLAFRAARKLKRTRPLADVAQKVWEIAPAETVSFPPSVALPGQFEKARAVEHWSTHEIERKRVHGGAFDRPPVKALQLRDAMLHQGTVVCGAGEQRILPHPFAPPPSRRFPVIDIDEGALAGSYLGLMFFGHWLKDDAPLTLLAQEYGAPVSPTPPSAYAAQFAEDQIAAYARFLELPWRAEENVRFRSLVVFDDEEFGTHKQKRIETLRARVAARMGPAREKTRVYIRRGVPGTGARRFPNEEAVIEAVRRRGFFVLDPSKARVEEIVRMLHGAEFVVGVEGSQTVPAIFFLPPGGKLLSLMPPDRFCTVNKRWTDLIGARYGFVTGDPVEPEGFTVNIDDFMRTIDLMEA